MSDAHTFIEAGWSLEMSVQEGFMSLLRAILFTSPYLLVVPELALKVGLGSSRTLSCTLNTLNPEPYSYTSRLVSSVYMGSRLADDEP